MKKIFKLQPIYKDAVWGESTLSEELGISNRRISEIWSFINTDEQSLCDGEIPISKIVSREFFPLVIKILNAAKDLSVQVHPQKNEAWYILSAKEGATLSLGFKNENFDIENMGTPTRQILDELVTYHPKPGEIYYIPQGAVHYLGGGIRALEVQTDLLTTYRIYDHDRLENGKPRQLHINEAKECINPKEKGIIRSALATEDKKLYTLLITHYFTIKKLTIAQGDFIFPADNENFCLICTKGSGKIENYNISKYDTVFTKHEPTVEISQAENLELILVYAF